MVELAFPFSPDNAQTHPAYSKLTAIPSSPMQASFKVESLGVEKETCAPRQS
jgi:hypothetical protein